MNVTGEQRELINQRLAQARRWIWVTFSQEGIHAFARALTDPALADVSFLGHAHRHVFHFRVQLQVHHEDREVEFIQFQRWLRDQYGQGCLQLNQMSCEQLATALAERILTEWPHRALVVEVSEDAENGARLELL